MTDSHGTQPGVAQSVPAVVGDGPRSADTSDPVLLHMSSPRTEISVAHLRDQALAVVVGAGLRRLGDAVRLVMSELATNAVRYGQHEAFDVRVRRSGNGVRIEVDDRTQGRFALVGALPDETAEQGRGLLMVEAVAQAWGTSADGRITWADVASAGK
ncbi:ATP-binding protein [Streptomyces sp. SL54]|uniref:ATP-binding protein n=1 Tax=Streptantibioticus silvisoli TaxID=2705255 RepID=A0ABT6VVW1_9ACTN|nr:ATP-binding protein [Streptantibioticus silvisoli]